jgi:hypothetical protein
VVSIENGGTNATTVIQAKTNLQLQNVNNTSDADKPVSTATQMALASKVDKVTGKGQQKIIRRQRKRIKCNLRYQYRRSGFE